MSAILVNHDGWWWPASDERARPVLTRECASAVEQLLNHVEGRDCIVQAGANVGVFPVALADHFQRVVTCEPDPENFACLVQNLRARDSLGRVRAANNAFGETADEGHIVPVERDNCGAHRVEIVRKGSFAIVPIDTLDLTACDAIWLDVEGMELPALKGAAATIERFNPTIAIEDKGHHRAFGIEDGALQAWLAERGYEHVDRIANDKVFKRTA